MRQSILRGISILLVCTFAVNSEAQHAIILSGSNDLSEIRIYRGIKRWLDDKGDVQEDMTTSYEMWTPAAHSAGVKKFLGCRGSIPYLDRELRARKEILYGHAQGVALLDLAGLVIGTCLATNGRCLRYFGHSPEQLTKKAAAVPKASQHLEKITHWITRITGITIIGGIATGIVSGVSEFLNPWRRWRKADAFTVVWNYKGSMNAPEFDFRSDIHGFANLMSEGLCDIDRNLRHTNPDFWETLRHLY